MGEHQERKQASGPLTTIEAVDTFLASLRSSGMRSATTVRLYANYLHRFAKVAPEYLDQVTRENIFEFMGDAPERSLAVSRQCHAALTLFYRWLTSERLIMVNPMIDMALSRPSSKPPARKLEVYSEEMIVRVLRAIPTSALRDRTLFAMLYETALRVTEVLGIQVADLELIPGQEWVHIRTSKTFAQRMVPLFVAPISTFLLKEYLRLSRIQTGPVFRGESRHSGGNKPLEYSVVHNAWQRYCKTAGVTVSLQQMRASRIHQLLEAGVSPNAVQLILGHRHIQSTMFYYRQLDSAIELYPEIKQVIEHIYTPRSPLSSLLESEQELTHPPSEGNVEEIVREIVRRNLEASQEE